MPHRLQLQPPRLVAKKQPLAAGGGEFHIAWPYSVAPTGHWNTFVANGIFNGSPYLALMEPPLFYHVGRCKLDADCGRVVGMVRRCDACVKLPPVLFERWQFIHVPGCVDTFAIYHLLNTAAWKDHPAEVKAVDDSTVDFIPREPSTVPTPVAA